VSKDSLAIARTLANDLIPFRLSFDESGQTVSASPLLMKIWNLKSDDDLKALANKIYMTRPFSGALRPEWLEELTGMIVHLHLQDQPERSIRGEFYNNLGDWLFTGFPRISSVSELESFGIQLSELPLHTAMGELLIANEANKASLAEAQIQAEQATNSNQLLLDLNERFERFVPTAILENIGINSPTDAERGRYVETTKAVMFADLRQFTTLSEALSARETFAVINQYLSRTVPCIEDNGGYVVQYLGDGIMALFPSGTTQAIDAAIGMQQALRDANYPNVKGAESLRMSIGIHEGPVALGIVGNETRWDASIIADAVNTSARIESMTRVLGGEIMVSREFLRSSGGADMYKSRELGSHQIRGRKGQLELIEILDSLDEEQLAQREETHEAFATGLTHYRDGDLYAAMSCFSRVLSVVPTDHAAQYYLGRISQRLQGLPE